METLRATEQQRPKVIITGGFDYLGEIANICAMLNGVDVEVEVVLPKAVRRIEIPKFDFHDLKPINQMKPQNFHGDRQYLKKKKGRS